jgi:hypothetical protein
MGETGEAGCFFNSIGLKLAFTRRFVYVLYLTGPRLIRLFVFAYDSKHRWQHN